MFPNQVIKYQSKVAGTDAATGMEKVRLVAKSRTFL